MQKQDTQPHDIVNYLPLPTYPSKPTLPLKKALGIISQSQHIIISKNLTEKQTTMLIENCSKLIGFIEKDYYPTSMLESMFLRIDDQS
jgi:hypothetical protein